MAGLAAIGAALFGYFQGPKPALAFLIGALAAWSNFRSWRRLIESLGESAAGRAKPPGFGSALLILLRLAIVAGGAFVVLRYSKESLIALLAGLFVSSAAVLLEALIAFTARSQ